ncbi:MAG: glycoside hydrolase family protein [Chloroflexi bacterium]|nr:glycoside hydrolase family protein [Chloroflexota bacterium]
MDRRLIFGFMPSWGSSTYNADMVKKMADAHTQSARASFNWDLIEPNAPVGGQHTYIWTTFDAQVDLLLSYRIESIETVVGTPWWARHVYRQGTVTGAGTNYIDDANANFGTGTYNNWFEVRITGGTGAGQMKKIVDTQPTRLTIEGSWDIIPSADSTYIVIGHAAFVLPEETQSNIDSFNAFCQTMATRYSGKVRYYEFWNEPNQKPQMQFEHEEYTRWLGRAHTTIKQVDQNLLVSLGGLSGADTNFLGRVYDYIISTLGQNPDEYFDAVAIHPYGSPLDDTGIQNIYNQMSSHQDSEKSIWVTEYGWDLDPLHGGISEQQQKDWLLQSLDILTSPTKSYVTAATFHLFADQPGLMWGVCHADLTERPAYGAFRDYAAPRTPRWESKAPVIQMV